MEDIIVRDVSSPEIDTFSFGPWPSAAELRLKAKTEMSKDKSIPLRRCGCYKHYPPYNPSQPFNDTPENRVLCYKLQHAEMVPGIFTHSNLGDGRGDLEVPAAGNIWVKTGDMHGLTEASTMRWVARHTNIPVPRVICATERDGETVILMEALPGTPLGWTWEELSPESRKKILAQLKIMFDLMRAIPCPPDRRYESVDGGPLYGGVLESTVGEQYPTMYGPCPSFKILRHQLERDAWHGDNATDDNALDKEERENPTRNYSDALPPPYNDSATCPPPVFTHGALDFANILVDGDTVTGIVQWQNAGWWPDYWEYASSLKWRRAPSEWKNARDEFLTHYPVGEALESERRDYYKVCSCGH